MIQGHYDDPAIEQRRTDIYNRLLYGLRIKAGLAEAPAGMILGTYGVLAAWTSVRRDDVGYAAQVLVPEMRSMLGLAERPDIVVKTRFETEGACVCDSCPCPCAISRKVHVMLYPKPADAK